MTLATIPLLFVLAGLSLYIILGGADFGAAIWQLSGPETAEGRRVRDFAHNVMAPVWEANHVWLIFVLTVTWTAYPAAFASIASTLAIPLLLAVLGVVIRGAAYAISAGASGARQTRDVDRWSAASSVLTPFCLGACVGAIASGRVPYGNARGDLVASWLNPTSIVVGVLAVAISAHLAAVYLCDDARRRGDGDLIAPYRRRALWSGAAAGALAVAGIVVLHGDAHGLYRDLVTPSRGLAAVVVSALAGVGALVLVSSRRFTAARYSAALAVVAVIAGWAVAQQPQLLPGLTVDEAAAPRETLVAVIVAVVGGGIVLLPSLLLLFRLSLAGRLTGYGPEDEDMHVGQERPVPDDAAGLGRWAAALLVGAVAFLTIAEAGWAHAIGVVLLLGAAGTAVAAAAPALLAEAVEEAEP